MENILYILGSVGAVSLISFVGVLTLSFREERLARIVFMLVAIATGALLGDAFLHLIPEAYEKIQNFETISFLIIFGMLVFFVLEKVLRWHHHHDDVSHKSDHENPKYLGRMILFSDGLHNLIDGVVIAASYIISREIGFATTLAVILHEIPQEIGDFGVLVHSGYRVRQALWFNFLSAATSLAGAMLVIFLGSFPEYILDGIIPFAAGTFIYIASSDLVPELHRSSGKKFGTVFKEIIGICVGVLLMYALLFLE